MSNIIRFLFSFFTQYLVLQKKTKHVNYVNPVQTFLPCPALVIEFWRILIYFFIFIE